jgi:hypothetical protein
MAEDSGSRVCKTGSPGFGWLCLARSVLALVVSVIAAIVLVKGMILVLQFDTSTVQLNVAQSDVFVSRYKNKTTMMHNTTYNYVFRFYLEANNPSDTLAITYSNIIVQLQKDGFPFATFDLLPSSLSLSQKEEQEYFVTVTTDNVTLNAAVQQILFPNNGNGGTMEGAAMVLYGHLTVLDLQRNVNKFDDLNTNFICKSVKVNNTGDSVPEPSSQNYNTECLMG